jgi:hypothetical protein
MLYLTKIASISAQIQCNNNIEPCFFQINKQITNCVSAVMSDVLANFVRADGENFCFLRFMQQRYFACSMFKDGLNYMTISVCD